MSSDIIENRFFQLIIFVLLLLTLFYGSDFMAIWEVEAILANGPLNNLANNSILNFTKGNSPLAELIISGGLSTVGLNEWGARISSLIILTATFLFFYKLASKIFTDKAALITILLAAGSFPLLLIGKVATTDIWLFGIELLIFPLVIYQLKKPTIPRSILIVFLNVLLVFVQPLSALLFSTLYFGSLIFLHKSGKQIIKEYIISFVLSLIVVFTLKLQWINDGFLFSFNQNLLPYIFFTFLGLISAFGFVPAVFLQLYQRLRIKEELAILSFAGLIGGFFSMSFLTHFILLFLVGKQLSSIENKNYPYLNSIKAFTILQVLLSFFIAFLFLMNGFAWFQGTGFRKGLIFGISIWGMGIYAIVAIFAKHKNHIITSVIFTGLIINFLFWTQIMPLWEAERNIKKEIATSLKSEENNLENNDIYLPKEFENNPSFQFYNKTLLTKDSVLFTSSENINDKNSLKLIRRDTNPINKELIEIKSFQGRKYPWMEMEKYTIVK